MGSPYQKGTSASAELRVLVRLLIAIAYLCSYCDIWNCFSIKTQIQILEKRKSFQITNLNPSSQQIFVIRICLNQDYKFEIVANLRIIKDSSYQGFEPCLFLVQLKNSKCISKIFGAFRIVNPIFTVVNIFITVIYLI